MYRQPGKNLLTAISPPHAVIIWWTSAYWRLRSVASLGHPCKFPRVSRPGSVTARHSSSGRQPNFAALNKGHHLYSAGRPPRWALAHILVYFVFPQRYCGNIVSGHQSLTQKAITDFWKCGDFRSLEKFPQKGSWRKPWCIYSTVCSMAGYSVCVLYVQNGWTVSSAFSSHHVGLQCCQLSLTVASLWHWAPVSVYNTSTVTRSVARSLCDSCSLLS